MRQQTPPGIPTIAAQAGSQVCSRYSLRACWLGAIWCRPRAPATDPGWHACWPECTSRGWNVCKLRNTDIYAIWQPMHTRICHSFRGSPAHVCVTGSGAHQHEQSQHRKHRSHDAGLPQAKGLKQRLCALRLQPRAQARQSRSCRHVQCSQVQSCVDADQAVLHVANTLNACSCLSIPSQEVKCSKMERSPYAQLRIRDSCQWQHPIDQAAPHKKQGQNLGPPG